MSTPSTPTAIRAALTAWLGDRRPHFASSTAANPGWYGLEYLLNDFKSNVLGYGHVVQRDFRRHVRAVCVPVVKSGRIWFAKVDPASHHTRPQGTTKTCQKAQEPRTATHAGNTSPQAVAWLLGLFAIPTEHNPGQ